MTHTPASGPFGPLTTPPMSSGSIETAVCATPEPAVATRAAAAVGANRLPQRIEPDTAFLQRLRRARFYTDRRAIEGPPACPRITFGSRALIDILDLRSEHCRR